jgi:hypothetical protein
MPLFGAKGLPIRDRLSATAAVPWLSQPTILPTGRNARRKSLPACSCAALCADPG